MTIIYKEANWQNAGLANETSLNLAWDDGGAWQTLLPCAGCELDMAANQVLVSFNKPATFALIGQSGYDVYLPVVVR